jgi:hypothetical protein
VANRVRGIRQKLPPNTILGTGPGARTSTQPARAISLATAINTLAQRGVIPLPGSTILVDNATPINGGAANKLLYDNGGTLEEASVGSGLSFSGGTLSSTGGTYNSRGAWSGSDAYAVNDVVTYSGSAYLCFSAVGAPAGTPPTLDGTANGLIVSANSGSVSLTTADSSDEIIVCVFVGTTNSTVPSVTGVTGSGLTFTKRNAFNGTDPGNATHRIGVEIWYASAASPLSSETIAVALSTTVDSGFIVAFGVNGASGGFDSSVTLPAEGTTSTLSLTTADAYDFVLYMSASSQGSNQEQNAPSGYSTIYQGGNTGGLDNRGFGVYYQQYSTTQSGTVVGGSGGSGYYNMMDALFHSITANPAPSTDDTHWLSQGASGGGGLTNNSTTISGGSANQLLYDNGGTLEEAALGGGLSLSAGTLTGGITALTGDVTASGSGSVAATLATVNSSPGSYTYSSLTVNAKGLVTAASSGTAPLTSLTGDVTTSSSGAAAATLATVNSTTGSFTNANITVNGKGLITAAANGSAGSTPNLTPGGRLSLSSGVAAQTADVVGGTTIYYIPYVNDYLPVLGLTIGSGVSLSLDSNSGHTGYQQSGKLFDLFLYNSSGTRLLGTGPAWTSLTARSAAIDQTTVAGVWTNTSTMTLKTDATSSTISASAGTALYIGTMYASANGQCTVQYRPAAAAGGSAPINGLFNAYNRMQRHILNQDSTTSWTYATAIWRVADAGTNKITFVDGLGVVASSALYIVNTGGSAFSANTGVAFNWNSGAPRVVGSPNFTSAIFSSVTPFDVAAPNMGLNTWTALEESPSANTVTFFGGTTGFMGLMTEIED